jgi:hypothetical protein
MSTVTPINPAAAPDKGWRLLPPPHETVSVAVYWDADSISVDYCGQPEALIASGAIEPVMAAPGRPGRRRRDSFGDRFYRDRFKDGSLKIQRLITSTQRARSLPGVPPGAGDETINWLNCNAGELHFQTEDGMDAIVGKPDDLVRRGYARSEMFQDATLCRESRTRTFYSDDTPARFRYLILRLMDGYYALERPSLESANDARDRRARELADFRAKLKEIDSFARRLFSYETARALQSHHDMIIAAIDQRKSHLAAASNVIPFERRPI